MSNREEVPAWAEQTSFDFKYASSKIKKAAKQSHISPKCFAVKQTKDGREMLVWVWNSRKAEFLLICAR
jgi:hypothetical protein